VESFACPYCHQIVPERDWLKYPPDPEWMATLEDDEDEEWLCPKCYMGFILAPVKPKQKELFRD